MKYRAGQRVAFYSPRGENLLARVIDASPDHVTIQLMRDGRQIRLEDHDGISRLSRLRGRR